MATNLLMALVFVSAALHLRAEYLGPASDIYIFKPLTMILILRLATRVTELPWSRYKRLIVAGLIMSLVGDVLLMLPQDLFVPGLVAFLVAHLLYLVAFRMDSTWKKVAIWPLALFAAYGLFMFVFLEPSLDSMLVPVTLYIVVICVMGWLAVQRWLSRRERVTLFAAVGAMLFIISDSLLAVNRFLLEFSAAPALVLITYYAAQWLLARSVEGGSPA